ncbi:uncharacterized protein I206_101981 [Kwoniella pini CBS 10737]|uniref:Uncharacterized protein n=1 Tax=Kwoniella pini CBS 10737 TaxID=1296096 RepID=A0A1B9HV59_9TREE|nr:uncharacterized protein I206_06927 [Kwoniella pini CBS 10737]OCF47149.1 hypothetical protein I206_06927 [Kwoniella pini CBS 10737]
MNQSQHCLFSFQQQSATALSNLSIPHFPAIPISPPAPHRKAPRPPVYSPRRIRPRHINMKEPAQLGLFTVLETEEDSYDQCFTPCSSESDMESSPSLSGGKNMYNLPSAVASSEIFPSPSCSPSPLSSSSSCAHRSSPINVPRDINEDIEMDEKLSRLSWSSKGSLASNATAFLTEGETESEFLLATPSMENDDPFGWSTTITFPDEFEPDVEMAEDTIGGNLYTPSHLTKKPTLAESIRSSVKRPPPLKLSTGFLTPIATPTSAKLFSAISNASTAESDLILTPQTATSPSTDLLLPSLPIISSIEWESRRYASPIPGFISPSTPTRSRRTSTKVLKRKSPDDPIDLAMALEDLLNSCGENLDNPSSCSESEFSGPASVTASSSTSSDSELEFESKPLRFPLPPNRLPLKTPSPIKKSFRPLTPYAPKKDRRSFSRIADCGVSPTSFKGDHSFLISLSMGKESVGSSSVSSCGSKSSKKSLPSRRGLPTEWIKF